MHLDSSAPNYSGVLRNVMGVKITQWTGEMDTTQTVLLESRDLPIAML